MDLFDGELNIGIELNLDIEAQKKTKAHGRQRLYA